MKITTTWFTDNFNVDLAASEGREPFLSIKGCRIVSGSKGEFVSWPARKNEQTGKWWNHVWGSEAFSQVVLEEAKKSQPQRDTRTLGERKRGVEPRMDDDDKVPF